MLVSQFEPVKPEGQEQEYVDREVLLHVAPYRHGFESHGRDGGLFKEQSRPEKPDLHEQVYPS